MPDIHIKRTHHLGLEEARKLAFRWAETAEKRLDMDCVYEEGKSSDLVTFTRSGVNGELKVTKDSFVLDARLGLLLGVFKERIEKEIVRNLDELLAHKDPLKAFEKAAHAHGHGHGHGSAGMKTAKQEPAPRKDAAKKSAKKAS